MISFIPVNSGTSNYKIKRSNFISFIKRINNNSDFKSWLSIIKKDHFSASHFCWAYQVYSGLNLEINQSDAGEPSGTAGKPILKSLKQHNIVNCGIVVVRYFGGKKLGRNGLIDAYSRSALDVIRTIATAEYIKKDLYHIHLPSVNIAVLSKLLSTYKESNLKENNEKFIILELYIEARNRAKLKENLHKLVKGDFFLEKIN